MMPATRSSGVVRGGSTVPAIWIWLLHKLEVSGSWNWLLYKQEKRLLHKQEKASCYTSRTAGCLDVCYISRKRGCHTSRRRLAAIQAGQLGVWMSATQAGDVWCLDIWSSYYSCL